MPAIPINKTLYNRVKQEAKSKFLVYPSIYANAWLSREYKKRGGKYRGAKPSKYSRSRTPGKKSRSMASRSKSTGLQQWFSEKWIDACKLPKRVPCGRSRSSLRGYPYCRPSVRVSRATPKTIHELSKNELKRRCQSKRKNPMKKVMPKRSRKNVRKNTRKNVRKNTRKRSRKR